MSVVVADKYSKSMHDFDRTAASIETYFLMLSGIIERLFPN